VLGVAKFATPDEIKAAYRKMAMKWHPDRHNGKDTQEEATEQFKQISLAYAILSDPQRRAAFDSGGVGAVDLEEAMANISVDDLGALGGMMGGMFGMLGVDLPTAVSPRVLDDAMNAQVAAKAAQLEFDTIISEQVPKASARFYKLKVTEQQSQQGVAIRAWSTNPSDRLKLLLFDSDGEPRWQQDSKPNAAMGKKKSVMLADMVCVPFDTIIVPPSGNPLGMEDPTVALFRNFDRAQQAPVREIGAGEHLIAVYGDNFMTSCKFQLHAVLLDPENPVTGQLQENEGQLRKAQADIAALERTYMDARRAFEAAQQRYCEEEAALAEVMAERGVVKALLFGVEPKVSPSKGKKSQGCAQQ